MVNVEEDVGRTHRIHNVHCLPNAKRSAISLRGCRVFFHNSKASERRVILYSQAELLRWVKSFRWIAETVPILSTKNSSILKTQCRKKKITDIYHHRHRGRSHVFSAVSTAWDNRLRSQDPGEAMGMRLNFNNDQNHYWTSISQKMRWLLLRSALPLPPPKIKKKIQTKQAKQTNKQRNQPEAKRHFYPDTIMFR